MTPEQSDIDLLRARVQELERENAYYRQRTDELALQIAHDSIVSRLKHQLRQKQEGFQVISSLQTHIGTAGIDLELLYARTLRSINAVLKMDRSAIFARSLESTRYVHAADLGYGDAEAGELRELTLELPESFFETRQMLVTRRSAKTEAAEYLRARLGLPFFVIVPISVAGEPVAVLVSGRLKEARPFFPPLDDADVNTFQSIAGFLGATLQNRDLYRRALEMAESFARFVPARFLEMLEKDSILDVSLGDAIQRDMTILFSDIRSFTTLSEGMTPAENFNFVNSYLSRVGPAIRHHNGWIDKYIGDAIMALFPEGTDDALAAAIDMQAAVRTYNEHRTRQGFAAISIGVGIHSGTLMLGTVGEAERLEGTVISDAVNVASRVEGLTKMYGATILLTGPALFALSDPTRYEYRFLGSVQVRGKSEHLAVFEVLNGDPPEVRKLKNETRMDFERALNRFLQGEYEPAAEGFRAILSKHPGDRAARHHLQRAEHFARHGPPPDFAGVEIM